MSKDEQKSAKLFVERAVALLRGALKVLDVAGESGSLERQEVDGALGKAERALECLAARGGTPRS
jgi:hypothetical protein